MSDRIVGEILGIHSTDAGIVVDFKFGEYVDESREERNKKILDRIDRMCQDTAQQHVDGWLIGDNIIRGEN